MGHLSYLRRMPNGPELKQGTPFSLSDAPEFFADHVNYYGSLFEPLYVSSVGYDSNWKGRVLDRANNRFLLYYVTEGRCYLNGETVEAGSMFFVLPNIHHTISQDPKTPAKGWWITVKGSGLAAFSEYGKFRGNLGVRPCHRMAEIEEYISEMVYSSHFGVAPEAVLSANLFQVIAIQRYENSAYFQQTTVRNRYVYEAMRYIDDHCMERLTVEDIAAQVHVSPKYLTNIFSKYANCSMRDYLVEAKMKVAQSLLKGSDFRIQDVSEFLGYSDYYQFSRQFKKQFGISPNEYKRTKK